MFVFEDVARAGQVAVALVAGELLGIERRAERVVRVRRVSVGHLRIRVQRTRVVAVAIVVGKLQAETVVTIDADHSDSAAKENRALNANDCHLAHFYQHARGLLRCHLEEI